MFEIMPILDSTKNIPLYVQLYEYIKQQIQNGSIKQEAKLPSKRKLSDYLEISQNTVQTAYDQLCAEGYVESYPRRGIFVTKLDDDLFSSQKLDIQLNKNDESKKDLGDIIDFSSGKVDLDNFPYSVWRKLTIQDRKSVV